ncbi:MAG TPA: CBS domain-containing protein, partial [Gaiellaceae bacterium]|nr:CBS domain-containing protein [Gaiellaceae bacterium]
MKVKELMRTDVKTVTPGTPLKEVAALLAAERISGVPVCDERGGVLGVVSEGDILFKERGPRERHGGPLAWVIDTGVYAEAVKAAARTAGEAMTAPAVTIGPERSVTEAARLMLDREVNRLPVV